MSKVSVASNHQSHQRHVTNVGIIWTLKNVQSNFSKNAKSCEGLPKLFRSMFPDKAIAKNLIFSKDKCPYYINYEIGPHYKSNQGLRILFRFI